MFNEVLNKKKEYATKVVLSYLPDDLTYQKTIEEAMRYSVDSNAKRLRPIILKECYTLFSGKETSETVEAFMAALEFIHTSSLIHDDLPAMDDDEYRRGRKTTHIVYGEAMAILAGDGLLNYAYEVAARALSNTDIDIHRIAKAMEILATNTGVVGMIGGQVVDVEMEGKELDEDTILFIHKYKTAALLKSSTKIGAVLGGASDEELAIMDKVAELIGIAFQIQDDILDITSTTEMLGKPVHSDEKNNKWTYVTINGLEESKKKVKALTDEAVMLLGKLPNSNEFLNELLLFLVNREK